MARVLFLQQLWLEQLGPMYLSAALKRAGHETEMIIEGQRPDDEAVARRRPDLLALSVITGSQRWALERAAAVKRRLGIPVIMGGPHATYFPEVIEHPSLDAICRGEGERALVEVAGRIDAGAELAGIDNLWVKSSGRIERNPLGRLQEDLDELPLPDRELYYRHAFLADNPSKSVITGRGCPYSCTWCAVAGLRRLTAGCGRFVRFRSPESVAEEVRELRRRYGLRTVIFQDDTFVLRPSRLERFLHVYKRDADVPFVCHLRADLVDDGMAALLRAAGCQSVDFGIESGDESVRLGQLRKGVTDADIERAARALHRFHLPFRTTNMIGLPGQTRAQAWKTVELNRRIGSDFPWCSVYQPYPRTELGEQAIASGWVAPNYSVDAIPPSYNRHSVLSGPDADYLQNLQKLFTPAVRWPRLAPLIDRFCRRRPGRLHDLVFLAAYGWHYVRSERLPVRRVLALGRRTLGSGVVGL